MKQSKTKRISLFVKGNVDLRDPIFGVRFGDGLQWGGIGAAFRELEWPVTVRIRHETSVGFFALTHPVSPLPKDIEANARFFGSFPPALQYSHAVFDGKSDAVLMSIQADVGAMPRLHIATGERFLIHERPDWPSEITAWWRGAFRELPPIPPDTAIADLLDALKLLRQTTDAPVLVANMTSAVPGDSVHSYMGFSETLSHRIRRFNLGLLDAAQTADFSILDIDRIVARGGADQLLFDPIHFSFEACRRIALEVARILEDLGVVEAS